MLYLIYMEVTTQRGHVQFLLFACKIWEKFAVIKKKTKTISVEIFISS